MTELKKIIITAVASGFIGYIFGFAQMWLRNRREDRLRREDDLRKLGESYLAMRDRDKNFDYSEVKRLGVLQNLGAHRFSESEIATLQKSVIARGFPDPLAGHSKYLTDLPNYPFSVFHWAKDHQVILGDEISVLESLISLIEKSGETLSTEQNQRLFQIQLALEVARGNI